jgi:hypothetical protein
VPTPGDGSLVAPFQFVLSGTEFLRCSVLSDDANVTVRVHGRMLRANGDVEPFSQFVRTGSALLMVTAEFSLGVGSLLTVFADVTGSGSGTTWGDTYAVLSVTQGTGPNALQLGILAQSYLAYKMPAVWPGTPFRSSIEGPPAPYTFALGNPGAGSQVVFTGASGYRLHVQSIVFQLTTDATGAARPVFIRIERGPTIIAFLTAPVAQAPSTTWLYTAVAGAAPNFVAANFIATIPLPPTLILEDTDTVRISTLPGLGAADAFTSIAVDSLRWLVLPGMGEA